MRGQDQKGKRSMQTRLALSEKAVWRRQDTHTKSLESRKGLGNQQAGRYKDRNKCAKNSEENGRTGLNYLLMALKDRVRNLDLIS